MFGIFVYCAWSCSICNTYLKYQTLTPRWKIMEWNCRDENHMNAKLEFIKFNYNTNKNKCYLHWIKIVIWFLQRNRSQRWTAHAKMDISDIKIQMYAIHSFTVSMACSTWLHVRPDLCSIKKLVFAHGQTRHIRVDVHQRVTHDHFSCMPNDRHSFDSHFFFLLCVASIVFRWHRIV